LLRNTKRGGQGSYWVVEPYDDDDDEEEEEHNYELIRKHIFKSHTFLEYIYFYLQVTFSKESVKSFEI
jgi:hypothetical protein